MQEVLLMFQIVFYIVLSIVALFVAYTVYQSKEKNNKKESEISPKVAQIEKKIDTMTKDEIKSLISIANNAALKKNNEKAQELEQKMKILSEEMEELKAFSIQLGAKVDEFTFVPTESFELDENNVENSINIGNSINVEKEISIG